MPSLLAYIRGPDLYATLKPKRHYEANWLERLGGSMIYFSQLIRAIAWPSSPIWLYYCATRITWDRHAIVYYSCCILCYHSFAFGARTIGRYFNPIYWDYLQAYCKVVESKGQNTFDDNRRRLQQFDFQITNDAPVSFVAKPNPNAWYLDKVKAEDVLSGQPLWQIQLKRMIAAICIYTFGRRMLYPGSIGFLKTLLFPHVLAGRLKLILEQNAERLQVRAVDGNIIDLIFVDRREIFPDQPLIICCDGNGGFYETGISRTPVDLNYSVLAWNPPGFSESSGIPYPQNILNAMDAVLQLAFDRGFKPQDIVLFGWSIGGFPATWVAANHPQIRGLILDASFDDIMPLALGTMPTFTEDVVKIAIREHYNLNVSEQLKRFNGPVRIIRRFNDEVVTTYHGPDLELRRKENRGNYLLLKFLQGRYPNIFQTDDDNHAVFQYLEDSAGRRSCEDARESLRRVENQNLEQAISNNDLRPFLIRLLCFVHFVDVPAAHVEPLVNEDFTVPISVNLQSNNGYIEFLQVRAGRHKGDFKAMRSRTSSGLRLDQLMLLVDVTILKHQDPVTGLVANNEQDFPGHAWVRDNLYAAHALWAMYRAYQKSGEFDEDLARAHELKMECIKIMQSLMECMMRQVDKVERFKKHQRSTDGLHAKYSVHTKGLVVTDGEWGHLQIDATSLFLLTLAQMTASGLQIIRNFDEVAFIQNLVYYVEIGYRTPDFGVWERGDKTNQGIRELNASSIGMAKAALQAINDVGDMFGDGSKGSVIHVLPDEIQQCSAVLSSMLPRESFSKETDASLLAIISYPAFAVEDQDLVNLTRHTITETLLGKYGCRRFLRDGYKTALEDPSRLYYINAELQKFENIECEWPVFLCYLLLDSLFRRDEKDAKVLYNRLQDILVSDPDDTNNKSIRLLPELYKVPYENVELERQNHGTQTRVPAGTTPFIWAQSLYVIGCLVHDGFLLPAEIDPLSRRFSEIEKRPSSEVQVVVLAETSEVQKELAKNDILVQTTDEIDLVFSIQPASAFAKILERVGESKKLGLTGRPMDRDIGLLSTSRLYHLGQKFVVFTPQFMDRRRSHLIYDIRILMDEWSSELQYIYNSWNSVSISGRPLVVLTIASNMLDTSETFHYGVKGRRQKSSVIGALKKIKNGYIGGARVVMKNISEFFRTTSVSKLELRNADVLDVFSDEISTVPRSLPLTSTELRDPGKHVLKRYDSIKERYSRQFSAVHQASMRHRSIVMDSNDSDLAQLRLAYAQKMKQTEPARDLSPVIEIKSPEKSTSPHHSSHLHTAIPGSASPTLLEKIDHNQMKEMNVEDLISMLVETTILDEQASLVHFLYLKLGMDYDTKLNGVSGATVKVLIEEVYLKACECREWSWVRLMAGLLNRQLDELSKAVTHLLVRQKQITVGMPSKNERAITSPKNKEDLRLIWKEAYIDDPNSYTLSQEIIICLGSLVRTDPNLFIEMLRLRIGLIIQVLASEISRIRCVSGSEALQQLLSVSPFELKSMLFLLLSGRLLEDVGVDEEAGIKELRTGMGSFRKQIEERKSMRKSKSLRAPQILESIPDTVIGNDASDVEDLEEDFQFGIWLRHRRIDGALNRVPPEFYANLWDTVRLFPQGLSINGIVLHRSLTQEMTRREIKFALQVEQVLNQISEPEYREMIVEVLTLMRRLEQLLLGKPQIAYDRPFDVDQVLWRANHIFCEHNREMNTLVMECCASGMLCKSAHGLCKHFYDSAPAGEFGTAHYMIKALIDIFTVDI